VLSGVSLIYTRDAEELGDCGPGVVIDEGVDGVGHKSQEIPQ
jgi:hypothetical protein